jgi:hypothetical protein
MNHALYGLRHSHWFLHRRGRQVGVDAPRPRGWLKLALEHAGVPCLIEPLFDVAWIGWHRAAVLGARGINSALMQALSELA